MKLTNKQQAVVNILNERYEKYERLSTQTITQLLNLSENFRDGLFTVSQVRSILVRLEKRHVVVRWGYPARWQLTDEGHKEFKR